MPFAYPAVVLAEWDIEHPIQAIFDSPVASHCVGQRLGRGNALGVDVECLLISWDVEMHSYVWATLEKTPFFNMKNGVLEFAGTDVNDSDNFVKLRVLISRK